MKRGSINWSLSDANRRPGTHDTSFQTVWHPTSTTNLYRITSFHSASRTPILLQWEWCHLPLLQRLQQMLPHLVLIEQAVSRLFSICKRCGKGKGRSRQQGGTRYGCDILSGGTYYSAVDSPGDRFRGGTVHGMTEQTTEGGENHGFLITWCWIGHCMTVIRM